MKKFIVAVVLTVVLMAGLLIFRMTGISDKMDLLQSAVILLLAGFGILTVFRHLSSFRKGEPAEDELSKMILQKSAALSYYVSLYLWLAITYISDKVELTTEQLLGYGIIGMALVFVASWSFFKIKGLKNE